MTWLLTLGITLAIVVALGASYYFWKKHKDISDMIQKANNSGLCKNPDFGKCFVNTIVDKFGFIRAKEVLGLGQWKFPPALRDTSTTIKEQKFMDATIIRCKCAN